MSSLTRPTALSLLVMACVAPPPAPQSSYTSPPVPPEAECFQFTLSSKAGGAAVRDEQVALTQWASPQPSSKGAMRVLPDVDPALPGMKMPYSEWSSTGDGEISILRSNGFSGVRMQLRRVGPGLEGTATAFSDTPGGDREFNAHGDRVPCRE